MPLENPIFILHWVLCYITYMELCRKQDWTCIFGPIPDMLWKIHLPIYQCFLPNPTEMFRYKNDLDIHDFSNVFPAEKKRGIRIIEKIMYRVGRIFPPDRNYQIPWNLCTLAQLIFEWNIPMGVGYNDIKYFFNKTSASVCQRLK